MATIGDVEKVLDGIAPLRYAQSWDNVGLLAGDRAVACAGVLLCVDLSHEVLDEAEQAGANLLVSYHPAIFKPIARLRADAAGAESLVWRAARRGCAIWSPHTALDVAQGGTNDVIAELCGLTEVRPLDFAQAGQPECKVVVFVPAEHVEKVAEAMFAAGAGWIGQYHHCSFRIPGHGTFWGTEATSPAVGQKGRLERVEETRLEAICPQALAPEVALAIRGAHPYEEPAFDIYPLAPAPHRLGMGRIGKLESPATAGHLARRLADAVGSKVAMLAGDADRRVEHVAVCVGSAGQWPLEQWRFGRAEALVTGEIKHHDARAYVGAGKVVIALSHWASERPALSRVADRLRVELPGLAVHVSEADRDVWRRV